MHKRFLRGFTIVELLVTITVIGIIVGATVVSYRGIRERGNDTAVQTDLTKASDALNVYYSDNTHYPQNSGELATIGEATFSRTNYAVSGNAVLYCVSSDGQTMATIGKSFSGKTYFAFNESTVKEYTTAFTGTETSICANAGVTPGPTGIWIHSTATGWMSNF